MENQTVNYPSETIATGQHLRLCRRGAWEFTTRTVADNAVGIVAITPERKLVLVEQYRPPVAARVIEIPAGLVGDLNDSPEESLLQAAQRELFEETGYEADYWMELATGYSSPGLTDESVTLFLADQLRKTGDGGGDHLESIVVHEVPLAEMPSWIVEQQGAGIGMDLKLLAGLYFAQQQVISGG